MPAAISYQLLHRFKVALDDIAFSPYCEQSYGRLWQNKRPKREVAGLTSGEIDLSRTTAGDKCMALEIRGLCASAHCQSNEEGRSGSLDPNNWPCSTYQVTDWMSLVVSFIICGGDATY